jgi:hypothetical protein
MEVNVSVEEMPEDRLGSTFICIVEKDMDAAAIKEDIIGQVRVYAYHYFPYC